MIDISLPVTVYYLDEIDEIVISSSTLLRLSS